MLLNFSDGFLFTFGWIVAKIVINFAVGFISGLLYQIWPWYKKLVDELDMRKHPWRYASRND